MIPEILHPIEEFFKHWSYTATAFFSAFGLLWVLVKLSVTAYKAIGSRAKLGQRQEFQGEYSNVWEARYDRLSDKYDDLLERVVKIEAKESPD